MTHYKNLLLIALLSLSLVAVSGCGGGGNPSSTVEQFFKAVDKGDSKTLEEVAGKEATMIFAIPFFKSTILGDGMPKSYSHTIKGDRATVTVTFENGKTRQFPLNKVSGKWQVQPPKS